MPTVGDLGGVRECLDRSKGVTTAAGTTNTTPKAKGITTAAGGSTTVGNGNGKSKGITTATTAICGCPASQACAVAGSLSGKRVIGRRRSRSQMIVPYR